MSVYIYSLEGNISAGKTTILRRLKEEIPAILAIEEPAAKWREFQGINMIKEFYADPYAGSFKFQTMIASSLAKHLSSVATLMDQRQKPLVVLMERCMESTTPFLRVAYARGWLTSTEFTILKDLQEIAHVPRPDAHIYLRMDPFDIRENTDVLEQIPETFFPDYHDNVHTEHDVWMLTNQPAGKIHVINNPATLEAAYQGVLHIVRTKLHDLKETRSITTTNTTETNQW
jgi:deoxyadenosine/deoxycytidine kinase